MFHSSFASNAGEALDLLVKLLRKLQGVVFLTLFNISCFNDCAVIRN